MRVGGSLWVTNEQWFDIIILMTYFPITIWTNGLTKKREG